MRLPIDSSLAFTALLDLDPDGFGQLDMRASGEKITQLLGAFYESDARDMYGFTRDWLAAQQQPEQAPVEHADPEMGA